MEKDTIAAIATPIGSNGIGIIRISGEQSSEVLKRIFRHPHENGSAPSHFSIDRLPSHLMRYGYIVHPEKHYVIDEVLVVMMRAPHSYTREDVVEIQSHSGTVILSSIMSLVLHQGVRLAEPGEFTKRAFLNGRIDLSQAEAVSDMVAAKTETALKFAATQLAGKMRDTIGEFISSIDQVRAQIEAGIEFGDEIESGINREETRSRLWSDLIDPIRKLISYYDDGHVLRDGIRLDIVGKPNVGKSSLLNCFLQKEKAIVTDIPGTTRDPVEAFTAIGGIPVLITDTAGLHDTRDPVELAGIRKTRESMEQSDVLLFIIDGSRPITSQDKGIWNQVKHKNNILVVNKIDLVKETNPIKSANFRPAATTVRISAKTGEGLETLQKCVKNACLQADNIEPGRTIIPNLRQRMFLESALNELTGAQKRLQGGFDDELVMENLNTAKEELSKICGNGIEDNLLDQIFGRFCIGK